MGDFKTSLGAGVAAAAVTAILSVTPASANAIGWSVPTSLAKNATLASAALAVGNPSVTFNVTTTPLFLSSYGAGMKSGNPSAAYTFGSFIGSGGGTGLAFSGGLTANTPLSNATTPTNGTLGGLFEFKGTVTVHTGDKFVAGHDDGLTLVIGGKTIISAPGQTAFTTTTQSYPGGDPTGNLPFTLVYGECCGAPAVLEVTLPLVITSVPEPASLALLGTGLAGLGAAIRRRRRKTA